jgi:hypothetical protein
MQGVLDNVLRIDDTEGINHGLRPGQGYLTPRSVRDNRPYQVVGEGSPSLTHQNLEFRNPDVQKESIQSRLAAKCRRRVPKEPPPESLARHQAG